MEKQEIQKSMSTIHPNKAIQYILDYSPEYAVARANRIYLAEYMKIVKSQLVIRCNETTITRAEHYALQHPDYLMQVDAHRIACEKETHLYWWLIAAQARIDVWRTEEASNRQNDRNTR